MISPEELLDPYEEAGKLQKQGPPGKKLVYRRVGNGFIAVYEDKPEASRLSGRHKKAIREIPDDWITLARQMGGKSYYRISNSITVIWYSGDHFLCLTCSGPDRYRDAEHRGCVHCERMSLYITKRISSSEPMEGTE